MKAEIKNSYDVRFLSSGGSTLGGVRNFSFSFEVSKPISINEARMLAVSSIEIALRTINSCAEIRPYLVEYPFPPSKLNIGLSIPPNNDIADSLRNIFFSHGRLSYFSHDEKCQIVLMFEEPLEDALDKIRKEQSLNINSFFEENL